LVQDLDLLEPGQEVVAAVGFVEIWGPLDMRAAEEERSEDDNCLETWLIEVEGAEERVAAKLAFYVSMPARTLGYGWGTHKEAKRSNSEAAT
jgi:hypothetical protein